MPRKQPAAASEKGASNTPHRVLPQLPAAAAFSFLKETKGLSTWTLGDLSRTLHLRSSDAKQVAAALEMQGYIKNFKGQQWVTTVAGEEVSGTRPPRFAPHRVEEALAALRRRIESTNQDPSAPFSIAEAVAFGGFLSKPPRVQPAEVGIRLVRKVPEARQPTENEFLKQLRAKSQLVNLVPYQKWMSARTHRRLL
jgi:hypothetical protein